MSKRTSCFALILAALFAVFLLPARAQDTTQNTNDPNGPSNSKEQVQFNWLYGAYVPKDVPLLPLTGKQRLKLYATQTFISPGIYFKTALFSVADQIRDSPEEWDRNLTGFAQRVGSRHGQFVIQNTLSALGNAGLGYEPRYDRCRDCSGFWSRTGHAILRNFVTYDRSETRKHPQFAMYGAALAAGAISSTWKPDHDAWSSGYHSVITQAGFGMAANFLSEFAPEINRVIRKPKSSGSPTK